MYTGIMSSPNEHWNHGRILTLVSEKPQKSTSAWLPCWKIIFGRMIINDAVVIVGWNKKRFYI